MKQTESAAIAALQLASAIVSAERNDEQWPTLPGCDSPLDSLLEDSEHEAIAGLAAELLIAAESAVELRRERDAFSYDRIGALRAKLVEIRGRWLDDYAAGKLVAQLDRAFVEAVTELLSAEGA